MLRARGAAHLPFCPLPGGGVLCRFGVAAKTRIDIGKNIMPERHHGHIRLRLQSAQRRLLRLLQIAGIEQRLTQIEPSRPELRILLDRGAVMLQRFGLAAISARYAAAAAVKSPCASCTRARL